MSQRDSRTPASYLKRRPSPPVVTLAVGILASTVVLLWHARKLWFFGDEWEFLYQRGLTGGNGPGPFEPHNEHWSTIPLVLYRVMWQMVGLQHYPLWDFMPIAALMVGSVGLFVLLRRAGAADWVAVACAVVLAWNGAGEDTLWAFQIGFLGSLTAGILACLAVLSATSWRGLVLANVLLVAGLMCSGLGIPMVAWAALFTLMLRGWRTTLAVAVVPTLVYLAWYAAYGSSAVPDDEDPYVSWMQFVTYVWAGIGHVWDVTTGAPVGTVMFVALVAVALFARVTDELHALAVSGVVTTVFAYGMLASSRADLGPEQAQSLRYVPLGLVLTLPAFAVLVGLVVAVLPGRRIERYAVAAGLVLVLVGSSYASTQTFAHDRANFMQGVEQRVLTGVYLEEKGEPLLRTTVEANSQTIDVGLLTAPGQRDHVPVVTPDDDELWTGRAQFRVAAMAAPADIPFAHDVSGVGVGGDLDLSDCAEVATNVLPLGYVEVPAGVKGTQIGLRNPGTALSVQLVHDGEVSEAATITTGAGQTVYVASNVPDADLRITLTTDTFGVCDHG
jgi:hypothetical protein